MKSIKPTEEVSFAVTQATRFRPELIKRLPFKYSAVLNNNYDAKLYLKKNYLCKRINIPGETKLKVMSSIIKRNAKYLRRLYPNFNKFGAKLSVLKHLRLLKELNLAVEFSISMSITFPFLTGKITPGGLRKILRTTFRADFSLEYIKSSLSVFKYVYRFFRHTLKTLKSISLTSNSMINLSNHSDTSYHSNQDKEMILLLPKISGFKNLHKLSLQFQDMPQHPKYFFDIFGNIKTLESLKYLHIRFKFDEIKNETFQVQNMQKVMEKFEKLVSLSLYLDFGPSKEFGELFTNLLPLSNLKRLKLILVSQNDADCSNLASFLSSLKSLVKLKARSCHLLPKQYGPLIKSIRALKGLKKLSLRQIKQNLLPAFTKNFSHKIVFKTLRELESVSALHIDIGNYGLNTKELKAFFKCLLERPSLEKAKICLRFGGKIHVLNESSSAIYEEIRKLRNKLSLFKVMLIEFPQEQAEAINKIISNETTDYINYSCKVLTISDIRSDFDLLDNFPVVY